jgi:phosphodiesterase/alkaline phosphatase D-like protein
MYSLPTRASLIIFTIIFGIQILNDNDGMSLLPTLVISVLAQEEYNKSFEITHGVASGEITNDSAVIWSRSNREAQMHVEYDISSDFLQPKIPKFDITR